MTVEEQVVTPMTKEGLAPAGIDLVALVESIDLQSIFLVSITAMRFPIELSDNLSVSFNQTINGQFTLENSLVYEVKHFLEISNGDKQAYRLELGHVVTYSLATSEPETKVIQQFGDESVRITIAPFVRELILRLTADAGLPPLLVGLAKRVSENR